MARKNPVLHLEGADALNRALKSVGDRATGLMLKRAAEAGAQVIADEAKALAPRDTGALAEGITTQPGRMQQGRAVMNIGTGKKEWYGQLVEVDQPFLRPAFDTKADEAKQVVGDVLRNALKDVLS